MKIVSPTVFPPMIFKLDFCNSLRSTKLAMTNPALRKQLHRQSSALISEPQSWPQCPRPDNNPSAEPESKLRVDRDPHLYGNL